MELTTQDIDVLIESVEAWERKDDAGRLMGTMLGAMLCKDDEQREKMQREQEANDRKKEQEQKVRKERSIVLRAKLIAIRDSMASDALFAGASHTQP